MNALERQLDQNYKATTTAFNHVKAKEELAGAVRCPLRGPFASYYAPGLGEAVYKLLTGGVMLFASPNGRVRVYEQEHHINAGLQPEGEKYAFVLPGNSHELATPLLGLALALTRPDVMPLTAQALRTFIQVTGKIGLKYPMTAGVLAEAPRSAVIKDALYALTDTLDAELRDLTGKFTIYHDGRDPQSDPEFNSQHCPQVNLALLIHPPRKQVQAQSHASRLARLTRRGGVALLVGPPGTFKTETAKRVAVEEGLHLVIAKGAPGVEDRDFIGAVYPTAGGPAWVDGPISRAFALAASEKTMLLIDEVLRYMPETLNVLVGALDAVSTAEALRTGIPAEMLSGGDRHYLLPLPNGEHLACPVQNLTWVMTTNLGQDHYQTADRLDGALLSRVDLTLEYQIADEEIARKLYLSVAGDERVADVAFQIELMTREAMSGRGALPQRALDARKTMAMIKETRSLLDDGLELAAAFLEAFETVALPYCCTRDTQTGLLDEDVREALIGMLQEEVLSRLEVA